MNASISRIPMRIRISQAVRDCNIEVIGREDAKTESHAEALIAVLRAFGGSHLGFVYVEPYLARKATRPHDILLCHPEVGVLVVEVKGYSIADISRVAAGNLFVKLAGGGVVQKNAFKQAETAMFDVKNAVERVIGRRQPVPLFDFVVALPRISEAEWTAKGYDRSLDRSRLLLREDLLDAHRVRSQVGRLTKEGLALLHRSAPIESSCFDLVKGVFGDSAVINSERRHRDPVDEETIGGMIEYEESIDKNLSEEQKKLSRLAVGEHPRVIRGVAGSGKSIVLANMAARYLTRKMTELTETPGMKIPRAGVVCFNRALIPFLRAKVRVAVGDPDLFQSAENSGMLTMAHFNDLMYELPVPYQKVNRFEDETALRARRYRSDLLELKQCDPKRFDSCLFDILFVDEGQDFVPEEYEVLREIIRPHPETGEKPILIFYDNAQNVYGRPQPTWSSVGIDVARGDRTRVMTECFRNTTQILELAFNVLYGSQAKQAVHIRQFLDLETLNKGGLVTEGDKAVRVHFAKREGAEPIIKRFTTLAEELEFVAEEIRRLVIDEYVRPSDILVLFVNDYDFKDLPTIISGKPGMAERIQGYLRIYGETPAKDEYIIQEDMLTLATIRNAKGYDSPIVFLMGVHRFDSTRTTDRALFYVGATRAKYRLYLTGLKYGNNNLLAESRDVEWALRSDSAVNSATED